MSRDKGDKAEELACGFLYERGFEIVERNFYSRFGEIDIIASKDDTLHFIEVKSGEDYEVAVANITAQKLSRLIKTGNIYLKKNFIDADFVYDAVIVTPQRVELIENITL